MLRRLILFFILSLFMYSCHMMANTIRDYKDESYMLDKNSMEIMTMNNHGFRITAFVLNLTDSNSKDFKNNYLIVDSFKVNIPGRYPILKRPSLKDSIMSNYTTLVLKTERDKTWYAIDLSPKDWISKRKIYFTKYIW